MMDSWFVRAGKRWGTPVAAIVVLLLLALLLERNGSTSQRVITVSGTGKVNVTPDVAYVTLGAQERAATPDGAVAANATVMRKVEAAVFAFGVSPKDIQTSGYNLNPNYSYSGGGPGRITGFDVTDTITVKVENLGSLGKLTAAAVDAGANQFQGVNFGLKDKQRYWSEAMRAAMGNAKRKAGSIAGEMGVSLGRPLNVAVASGGAQSPMLYAGANRASMQMAAPAPVFNPGTGQVEVQVVASFAY